MRRNSNLGPERVGRASFAHRRRAELRASKANPAASAAAIRAHEINVAERFEAY